jgi:hypothetical protein
MRRPAIYAAPRRASATQRASAERLVDPLDWMFVGVQTRGSSCVVVRAAVANWPMTGPFPLSYDYDLAVGLYAEMFIRHRPNKMSARVRGRIGFAHDLGAVDASRHVEMPPDEIDYATSAPTYRLVGFAASAIEYQLTIEADQYDVVRACETVWRAVAGGSPWGARPRLLGVAISDDMSNVTVLRATTGMRAGLRPEVIGILGTGALALLWLAGGLLIADKSVHDDIVVGASPPVIAAIVTFFTLVSIGRRRLAWAANT